MDRLIPVVIFLLHACVGTAQSLHCSQALLAYPPQNLTLSVFLVSCKQLVAGIQQCSVCASVFGLCGKVFVAGGPLSGEVRAYPHIRQSQFHLVQHGCTAGCTWASQWCWWHLCDSILKGWKMLSLSVTLLGREGEKESIRLGRHLAARQGQATTD